MPARSTAERGSAAGRPDATAMHAERAGEAATRAGRLERIMLAILFALVVIGLALALYDARLFRMYTNEDGPIENLTVVMLLGGAWVCFRRAWLLRRGRRAPFLAATVLLGVLYVGAAGEELSWGQHFIGFAAPEFFRQHNAQRETNLHNLVVQGVKINRLVFGTGLLIAVLLYCSVLPVGYRRWPWLRRMADSLAVPVPRTRHIGWYGLLALIASVTPSKFRWEVLELVSSTMFLLITTLPLNIWVFRAEPTAEQERGNSSDPRRP
jgi:hypothetical protein